MKYLLTTIGLLFLVYQGIGQDSLRLDSQFDIDIKGQHILSALMETPIESIGASSRIVSDNPFHHFAIYAGLNYKGTLAKKFSFETGLYLEERSFSRGNNTLEPLVIFPRIKISAADSFRIGSQLFKYNISAGDTWNEDFNDILRIYNIDFQGLQARVSWNEFSLGFSTIGDLSQNIGLDLHELYKLSIGYEKGNFKNVLALSVNELFNSPRGWHPQARDFNISNYSKFRFSENLLAQFQVEMRLNEADNASFALGINLNYKKGKLELVSGIRYYQYEFNRGYRSSKPSFRDGQRYIGTQLYALKNYYRPLNQWALMTNYFGRDVFNWELRLNWEKKIYKKAHFISEIDFNLIYNTQQNRIDYYPLYNIGLSIHFLKNFTFSLTGTNKHMNLDTYYQTFYASQLPLLSYSFKMDLSEIKTRPVFFKY
jgi:hypothetical protein